MIQTLKLDASHLEDEDCMTILRLLGLVCPATKERSASEHLKTAMHHDENQCAPKALPELAQSPVPAPVSLNWKQRHASSRKASTPAVSRTGKWPLMKCVLVLYDHILSL